MEERWLNDYVFTVDEFLTAEECDQYLQISEDIGFEDALVNTPQGQLVRADVRNNQRVMFSNEEIASWLWERAADFVPHAWDGRRAVGVNEMLRFYRYDPGQQFDWHQDFSFERDNGEQSRLTFMIYLNDDCVGGETSFEDSYSDEPFDALKIVPKRGMALFFEHSVHHKGEPVVSGRKYVLRTDVMYAAWEDEEEQEDSDDLDDEWE